MLVSTPIPNTDRKGHNLLNSQSTSLCITIVKGSGSAISLALILSCEGTNSQAFADVVVSEDCVHNRAVGLDWSAGQQDTSMLQQVCVELSNQCAAQAIGDTGNYLLRS